MTQSRAPARPSGTAPTPDAAPAPLSDAARGQMAMMRLLQNAQNIHTLKDVDVMGEKFDFKYRVLLHDDINRIISECWTVATDTGTATFDANKFFHSCVQHMFMQPDLVEQQPFPLTDRVIAALTPEMGAKFTELIPNINALYTQRRIEDAKKE